MVVPPAGKANGENVDTFSDPPVVVSVYRPAAAIPQGFCVAVGVDDAVAVGVAVAVPVAVATGVLMLVAVAVAVGVLVLVAVDVATLTGVLVAVGVAAQPLSALF